MLLGKRKCSGKVDGFVGHVQEPEDTRIRAVAERARHITTQQSGLRCRCVHFVGSAHQKSDGFAEKTVLLFLGTNFDSTEVLETDRMVPKWYDVTELPTQDMWEDVATWLPILLSGSTMMVAYVQ